MNVNKVILIGNLGRESWVRPVVGEPRHTTVVAREPINMPHVELIDMVTELHKKIIMVTHKAGVVDCHIEDVQDRGGGLVPLHEGATGPPGARGSLSSTPPPVPAAFSGSSQVRVWAITGDGELPMCLGIKVMVLPGWPARSCAEC